MIYNYGGNLNGLKYISFKNRMLAVNRLSAPTTFSDFLIKEVKQEAEGFKIQNFISNEFIDESKKETKSTHITNRTIFIPKWQYEYLTTIGVTPSEITLLHKLILNLSIIDLVDFLALNSMMQNEFCYGGRKITRKITSLFSFLFGDFLSNDSLHSLLCNNQLKSDGNEIKIKIEQALAYPYFGNKNENIINKLSNKVKGGNINDLVLVGERDIDQNQIKKPYYFISVGRDLICVCDVGFINTLDNNETLLEFIIDYLKDLRNSVGSDVIKQQDFYRRFVELCFSLAK